MTWRAGMTRRLEALRHRLGARSAASARSRERVQGLLAAVVSLAEDLTLEPLLDRTVRSACALAGARYGAIGITDRDRALSHFTTCQPDEDASRETGSRPVNTLLTVPIRLGELVLGYLHLTGKQGGEDFTAEDRALCTALATAAAAAISSARFFEDRERQQRWLEMTTEVTDLLLTALHPVDVYSLDLVAGRARDISDSAVAVIAVVAGDGAGLLCRTSVGLEILPTGRDLPSSTAVAQVLRTGRSAAVSAAKDVLGSAAAQELGPALIIPLGHTGTDKVLLILARAQGAPRYRGVDLESGTVFGSHIALALELVRSRRTRQQSMLHTDRERIARDLHDLVIQRLFAAGLGLQSVHRYTVDEEAHARIASATGELDGIIRQLRATISALGQHPGRNEPLSSRMLRLIQDGATSEVSPRLEFAGTVDATVPERLSDHLLAVLEEGMSNAIKHSGATHITASVTTSSRLVTLMIVDDGGGFSSPAKRRGLSNMENRCEALNGDFTIDSPLGTGTRLTWTAPLSPVVAAVAAVE